MANATCTQDAAVRLMLKFPFWSELYYSMGVVEDYTIPTLATDGRTLWVNPDFWKTMTLSVKISAIAHEVAHKMLLHCTRRGHRNPLLWNIAADYVVNNMLAENGMELGKSWLHNPKYAGWSVEAVYSDLEKQAQQQQQQPQPQGGQGNGEVEQSKGEGEAGQESDEPGDEDSEGGSDAGAQPGQQGGTVSVSVPGVTQEQMDQHAHDIKEVEGSPEQKEKYEQEVQKAVQKAIMTARAMGSMPAGVEVAVEDAYEPAKEPWYNHLHRFMQSLSVAEYNWAKINKKIGAVHGFCAPHHYSESLGEIVLGYDTSGSVCNAADQAQFSAHVQAIFGEAKPAKVHVCYFDAKVQRVDVYEQGDMEFVNKPKGGGGTDFRPVFDYIEQEGIVPAVLIMLTDTYGTFPAVEPEYPVIWASVEAQGNAPWGDVIYVE